MIQDRDPVATAVQLYNRACVRTTRTRLTWLDSDVYLKYQGGDQCCVDLLVVVPYTSEKLQECVYFNNIPDGIKCYKTLKSKIAYHPGTVVAATVFIGMILLAIIGSCFGV